jgi:hypothetical protein
MCPPNSPPPEQQNVVHVDAATLRKAEKLIQSCKQCNAEGRNPVRQHPYRVTGSDPSVTGLHSRSTHEVSELKRHILEKTLIEPG